MKFDMRNHLAEMEKARKLKIEKLNIELSKKKREINRFKPKHFGATSQSAIDRLSTPTIGQLRSTSHRYGNILQKEEPEMLKKFQKNLHKMESDVETVRKFRVLKIQEFKPEVEVRAQNPRPGKLKKTKDPKIPEPVWRHKSGTPDPDRLAFLSQPRIGLLVTTLEEHGKLIEKINPNIKENLAVRIQNSSIEKHKLRHKEDVKEVKPIKHFSAKEWKERCFLQSQPKTNYLFQVFEDHQHLFSEEKKDKLYQFIHELDKRDLEKKSVQRALKFCQPKAIKKVKEARHPDRAEILSIPKKLAKLEDPRKLLKPEDLEDEMRQEMNPHQKLIQRQVEIESLYSKIEKKVNKELFEEIADRLMAKLPKMIVDHNFPFLLSDNAKNLYDAACKTLSNYSKCPKNDLEIQNYCNFASIISENVISLLHNSLEHPKIKPKNRAIVPLKTVQRNKDLMEIADEIVAQRI